VDSVIRDVLHDNDAFYDVKLYASLMVDGLGEHITFKLSCSRFNSNIAKMSHNFIVM
jgi:hypothetical protein